VVRPSCGRGTVALTSLAVDAIAAYSSTGEQWQRGPGKIYDRLAEVLIERSPVPVGDATVADIGAGTGAGSRSALAAGAKHVVALDPALGMLTTDAIRRPPALVADACRLPLRSGSVDLGLAAFSFNHLADPAPAFAELRRVLSPTGGIVVGTYAADDAHPAKQVVDDELGAVGWEPPSWYAWMRERVTTVLAHENRLGAIAEEAGFADIVVRNVRVEFPELGPADLVAWRLGMAQHAPFLATLASTTQRRVAARATARLRETPTLVRSVLVLTARSTQCSADPGPHRRRVRAG